VSGYSGKPVVQKLGIKPGVTEAKGLAARLPTIARRSRRTA
jgi:hypothetical protein